MSKFKKQKKFKTKLTKMQRKQERLAYVFITPAIIMFLLFVVAPIIMAFVFSLYTCDWNTLANGTQKFVGFKNYIDLLTNTTNEQIINFRGSFKNVLFYVAIYVPVVVCLSLLFAVLVNQKLRGAKAFRVMYYIPSVTSGVAAAFVFSYIFSSAEYGLLNQFLLGGREFEWLGTNGVAMACIAVVNIWGGIGGNMIIYLAALQGVPPDIVEASKVDGASKWQTFYHITLPQIGQSTFFVVMMSLIGAFQLYDQVDIMTGGGYNTTTPVFSIYQAMNGNQLNMIGVGNAMAMILFVVIIVITSINNYCQNKINDRFN